MDRRLSHTVLSLLRKVWSLWGMASSSSQAKEAFEGQQTPDKSQQDAEDLAPPVDDVKEPLLVIPLRLGREHFGDQTACTCSCHAAPFAILSCRSESSNKS